MREQPASFLDVEIVAAVEREASRDLPCVFSLLATSRADTMQALLNKAF